MYNKKNRVSAKPLQDTPEVSTQRNNNSITELKDIMQVLNARADIKAFMLEASNCNKSTILFLIEALRRLKLLDSYIFKLLNEAYEDFKPELLIDVSEKPVNCRIITNIPRETEDNWIKSWYVIGRQKNIGGGYNWYIWIDEK